MMWKAALRDKRPPTLVELPVEFSHMNDAKDDHKKQRKSAAEPGLNSNQR